MTISFDKRADALYLAFSDAKSAKTIEIGNALIDFDGSGKIIGVEVLNFASKSNNGKIEIEIDIEVEATLKKQ